MNTETMRRAVMVVCAALLFVSLSVKSRPSQNLSARPAFRVLSSSKMLIKVSGDVHHPGIYAVPAKTLAISVIKMALPKLPLGQGNNETIASAPLLNGQAVDLATRTDGTYLVTVDVMTVPERMVLGIPLDISRMSEADFDRLPGIGPALAKRIVTYRQNNGGFLRFNDLIAIEGMGDKKLELMRTYIQPAVIHK
ncbi:MAG: helix-hairpin-helix domain-containing protein [Desulfuromonadales bacterium]